MNSRSPCRALMACSSAASALVSGASSGRCPLKVLLQALVAAPPFWSQWTPQLRFRSRPTHGVSFCVCRFLRHMRFFVWV
jgi:hypothetical protein